jgi:hypothetical protein
VIVRGYVGAALVAVLTLFHLIPLAAVLAIVLACWHLVALTAARGVERRALFFLFRTELYAAVLLTGLFVWSLTEMLDSWQEVHLVGHEVMALLRHPPGSGQALTHGAVAIGEQIWDHLHLRIMPLLLHELLLLAFMIWLFVRLVRGWLGWCDHSAGLTASRDSASAEPGT